MFPTLCSMLLFCFSMLISTQAASTDWVEDCRQDGLDPWQLACKTCQILPQNIQKRCQECCQSYKDVERITRPYQAAVLQVPSQTHGGDLETFLQEDWNELVAAKGSDRLQKIERNVDRFSFFSPTLLYFLEAPLDGSVPSRTSLKAAKETIHLDGWKREDMKDMIMTLLP